MSLEGPLGEEDEEGGGPAQDVDPVEGGPWLTAALEEYRALRQEIVVSLQTHLATLRYGFTAATVLIGLAVQLKDTYLSWLIALVIVPLIVIFAAVTWMGEYERMARAGHFIAELEVRINTTFGSATRDAPMQWERWLREGGPDASRQARSRHRYFAILVVFIALHAIAIVVGLNELADDLSREHREEVAPLLVLFNLTVVAGLVAYFRRSYARLRAFARSPDIDPTSDTTASLGVRTALWLGTTAVILLSIPLPLVFGGAVVAYALPSELAYLGLAFPLGWLLGIPVALPGGLAFQARDRWSPAMRRPVAPQERLVLEAVKSAVRPRTGELERLGVLPEPSLFATPAGRERPLITALALRQPSERVIALLGHELAHYRLGHLRPAKVAYDYLALYCHGDVRVELYATRTDLLGRAVWALWRISCLLPARGLRLLRRAWRLAEEEADAYVVGLRYGIPLAAALDSQPDYHPNQTLGGWQLGPLHPSARHRVARVRRLSAERLEGLRGPRASAA